MEKLSLLKLTENRGDTGVSIPPVFLDAAVEGPKTPPTSAPEPSRCHVQREAPAPPGRLVGTFSTITPQRCSAGCVAHALTSTFARHGGIAA